MNGDQKLFALVVCAIASVLIVVALASDGCQQTASVTCPNGGSYSTQEWGGEPEFSTDDAEEFCKGEKH